MVQQPAVAQAAGGDGRQQSRPLDESDAAPTPPGVKSEDAGGAETGPAAAKKRKLAGNARGVANLTPEQLAKKRANGTLPTTPLPWQSFFFLSRPQS